MVNIRTAPYIKKEVEFVNFGKSLENVTEVKKISDPFQFSESIRTSRLTVVYFNLPYYNPCKYFNPKFLKMVDEFKQDVNFIQVKSWKYQKKNLKTKLFQIDCEEKRMRKWANEQEGIRVFPSFKFYLNG